MRYINLKTKKEEASLPCDSVLCIGNFDGVHLGHRQLVVSVLDRYEELKSVHPQLLRGAWLFDSSSYKSASNIFSLNEKLDIFCSLGLDYAIIADFNEVKSLSPESFVNDILKKSCRCVHAVCGENFRFGSCAAGDASTLKAMMNGNTTVVPLLSLDNGIVSSTRIRELLSQGSVEEANRLLGSRYSVCEPVIHGKALGRTIGVPTINQSVTSKELILGKGVYATICTLGGKQYLGVTNHGTRPTVENTEKSNLETYIIDYNGFCYGQNVKIEFTSKIRDEIKFESIHALKNQIEKDISTVKNRTRV